MPSPIAVLVEDDPQQAEVSSEVLNAAGYDVRSFSSIAPALEYLHATDDSIDLFVLDRRLPVNEGETAADELGDGLLTEVRTSFPDAAIVVFTGFATVRHVRDALQGGGSLPAHGEPRLDRITVLEKDESIEFKQHVEAFRTLLQSLDDIEVVAPPGAKPLNYEDRRAVRRLAFEYWAVSVKVTPLGGGLTGAAVWRCELFKQEGHIATVVAKRVPAASKLGGLPELLPRSNTTSVTGTISGLMAGDCLNVLQLAGSDPFELMSIVASEPQRAVSLAQPLWAVLGAVDGQQRTMTISEICDPLLPWDELSTLLAAQGMAAPSGTLTSTVKIAVRHGDLHPGNVLIDNDQAVLIDFDSTTFAAGALDPVTMLISTLVHPDSPLRGEGWPSAAEIEVSFGQESFGAAHKSSEWFAAALGWSEECRTSQREFWALVLAYATRQLRYDDVVSDKAVLDRVLAIAALAISTLNES